MTANWFEAKVKYIKMMEDGRERKVTESYLLDAMTYTEAEGRVIKELESMIRGDYYITSLKKSNITELLESEDEADDRWYKAKVDIIDAEEISGKEKSSSQYHLIAAANIEVALQRLKKSLETYIVPCELKSLTDTNFMDVFPYLSEEEELLPDNFKPVQPISDFDVEENDDFNSAE
ncbi:MAG: DUF4494 domain-containing protein [Culturomica sp.]|jgi:hypothetical protein|nr:DUF4494 domain-containing protein [Culturomica sp.]